MRSNVPITILASLSFEPRCVFATLQRLNTELIDSTITMLDYGSVATPGSDATALRHSNWTRIRESALSGRIKCRRQPIHPFSMSDIEELVTEWETGETDLLTDISCMTRPHLLGLAVALARVRDSSRWTIAYTRPLSYGDLNSPKSTQGWRDCLWLPFGEDPVLRHQGVALGLVLAGHEPDRVATALREIEPGAGIAVVSHQEGRPDLNQAVERRNRLLFAYLSQIRMPGPRGQDVSKHLADGGWEFVRVALRSDSVLHEVTTVVERIVRAATALESPIIFIPFGPKIVVFIAAWLLAKACRNQCWAIYPVAGTHPIGYSDGVAGTQLVEGKALAEAYRGLSDRLLGPAPNAVASAVGSADRTLG